MFLLASRGRAKNVQRFFTLWTLTGCNSPGILWVDEDDAEKYKNICLPDSWRLHIELRAPSLGEIINRFFAYYPSEKWYGLLADDIIPCSKQFDRTLIDNIPQGGLCYPDDGRQHEKTATHPVFDGDMVRELGWISLPGLSRTYIDNTLMEYARKKDALKYVPEAKLFHLHFSDGTAPNDAIYAKPESLKDKEIYDAWLKQLYAA